MKLYYPKSHYDKNHRGLLFPLLKPFIKGARFTDAQRIALYGVSEKDFQYIEDINDADFVILTMAWNFYAGTKQEALAIALVKECAALKKKVITFNTGDFGVKIPFFENLIVFRHSGDLRKVPDTHLGLPVFIDDPLAKIFKKQTIKLRPYQNKPTVGFCGQANNAVINASLEILKTIGRNTVSLMGTSKTLPQQVLSTSYLRASILKSLQEDARISENFILRKHYRAGATTSEMRKRTTTEFYQNIQVSDYVVCARGAGNFSVRFYETLAMGRIPVFVDTHCLLPLPNTIDWKKHVVWVDYTERKQVAEKVLVFHERLTPEQFKDLQLQNRRLWEEYLTIGGFFKSYLSE